MFRGHRLRGPVGRLEWTRASRAARPVAGRARQRAGPRRRVGRNATRAPDQRSDGAVGPQRARGGDPPRRHAGRQKPAVELSGVERESPGLPEDLRRAAVTEVRLSAVDTTGSRIRSLLYGGRAVAGSCAVSLRERRSTPYGLARRTAAHVARLRDSGLLGWPLRIERASRGNDALRVRHHWIRRLQRDSFVAAEESDGALLARRRAVEGDGHG